MDASERPSRHGGGGNWCQRRTVKWDRVYMSEEDETISKVYVFWRHVLECDMCRILRNVRFSLVFDAPDHLSCPGLSANKSVGKIPQKISRSPRQKHGRRKSAGILQTKHKHKSSTWSWYTCLREGCLHYSWMKGTRHTIFSLRPPSCHKSRRKRRRRHTFATWLHQPPLCFMF